MIDLENYLSNFFKGTKNPSLDAMQYFMNLYQNFEREMKFIHIAGTNGKGSCTEMMSHILINQGYKVGKFISPHLIRYNERISINGKEISNQEMIELIEELQPKIENYHKAKKIKVTLFELETIMALLYFYRKKVDFVILETGLGGLYDCTNIITQPIVSIITSIGYDHTHILGDTLPKIAYQKAGIMKENSNTVFFQQSEPVNQVLIKIGKEKNNQLHMVMPEKITNYHYDFDFQYFDYENLKQIAINLKGIKQVENASLCIETVKILNCLGYKVSEENMRKGLASVIHKGRMEVVNQKPLIIYDGAHNVPAIQNLQNTVNMYYKQLKRVYIIAILKRKNYAKMLKLLLEDENATFLLTSGNNEERYTAKGELYKIAMQYKKDNQTIKMKSLNEAMESLMKQPRKYGKFCSGKLLYI